MARATRGKPCICWLLLLTAIFLQTSPCGFAGTSQQALSELREQCGRAIRQRAAGMDDAEMSPEDGELLANISSASKRKDWLAVKSFFESYAGSAAPIYTAAMRAASKDGQYRYAAEVYEKCRANCKDIGLPAYTTALQIFRQLKNEAMVQQIWTEALEAHGLDKLFASARIAAAADAGDVEAAKETLDRMEASNISIDVRHMNSAMQACWGWGDKQHKAARYFFDLLPRFNITPTVVTFTTLIGSYSSESLQEILSAYNEMKDLDIKPDRKFAETYLFKVLPCSKGTSIEDQIPKQSKERLQAARSALDDFKRAGVPLSGACKGADRELTRTNGERAGVPLSGACKGADRELTRTNGEVTRTIPTVVTFTTLIGSYSSESLQEILSAYNEMKDLAIKPDRTFAETYLFKLLQCSRGTRIEDQIPKQSKERLQATRSALDDFKRAGVPLSGACKGADRELTRMGF
eukprot:Skav201454  [mRNA]  locus=scaffold6:286836:288388:+ [translate_table: standard]